MLAGSTLNHTHAHRHGLESDETGFKPDNKRAAPRIVPRPVVSRRCLGTCRLPNLFTLRSTNRILSSSQLCTDFASKRAGRWDTRFWPNRYIRGGCRTHAFRVTRGGGIEKLATVTVRGRGLCHCFFLSVFRHRRLPSSVLSSI